MNRQYLETGLSALARVPEKHPGTWFSGHTGAAILSGCFLLREIPLEKEVQSAVQSHIGLFADEASLDHPEPFAGGDSRNSLDTLVSMLEQCVNTLSADGHGVIFATLALKAFHACPHLISNERVSAICKLLDATFDDDPGRYYGIPNYKDEAIRFDDVENFETPLDAAIYSLGQHATIYPDRNLDGKRHFFAGDQLHLITHAHALLELDLLGYGKLARRGLSSWRKQLYLIRNTLLPDGSVPAKARRTLNPAQLTFWQERKADTHQIKLAYSLLRVLQFSDQERHATVLRQVAPYWELMT